MMCVSFHGIISWDGLAWAGKRCISSGGKNSV